MGKNRKQVLAILLIVALFFGTLQGFPTKDTVSFAVDETYLGNLVRQWMDTDGFTYDQTKTKLQNYLGLSLYKGKIGDEINTYANVNILYYYDKLVYTKSSDDRVTYFGREDYQYVEGGTDGKGEYRYLGYTRNGIGVTNSRYPNLPGTTDFLSTYDDKNYVTPPEADSSWQDIASLKPLDKYMLTEAPITIDNRNTYFDMTVYDVYHNKNRQYVTNPIESAVDALKKYTIFQTPSTLRLQGSVRTVYENATGTKEYYRTLNTSPIPFKEPTIKFEVDSSDLTDDKIVFATTEETKTVTVHAIIEFPDFDKYCLDGWVLSRYIESAEISVLEQTKPATPNDVAKTITKSFDIELNRTDYVSDDTTFNFKGSATVFAQNYFKDQFKPEASLSVPVVVNMGPVEPAFKIMYNGLDYTDSELVFKDWQNFNLSLVPDNQILSNNEIKSVVWRFNASPTSELKYGNNSVAYLMNASKKDSHLTGNTATFTMTVNMKYPFDYGEQKNIKKLVVTHTLDFVQNNDPVIIPTSPPVAKGRAKSQVRLGDEFNFSGAKSYDPDGTIVDYHFWGSNFEIVRMKNDSQGRGVFLGSTGSEEVHLRVKDNDNLTDTTDIDVEVIEAITARFQTDGQRKENRLLWLDASNSEDSKYYPIIDSGVSWSIDPLEGQSPSSIVYKSGKIGERIGVMFKESGAYQVTLNISANCTYPDETGTQSDSVSYPITIQPDLPPVAGTAPMTLALRNPSDNNIASIQVADTSYSPDGDLITRQMYYKYDSDNDGSYNDESAVKIGSGQIIELLRTGDLGRYFFYSEVTEIIPDTQTIKSALSSSDYLTDSSVNGLVDEQECLVDNVAPIISPTASLDKEVDVVFITDENGENTSKLLTQMDRLNKELYERKIKLNAEYININAAGINLLSAGLKKIQTFTWNRIWNVFLHWKWYEHYREGAYSYLENPTMKVSDIAESRNGTVKDMIDFPTYPDAYAEIKRVDSSWASDGEAYDVDRVIVDVYNAPNDYLMSDTKTYPYGSAVANRSQSDKYWLHHNQPSRLDGANIGRLDISGIHVYPDWDYGDGYVSDWTPGTLLSETDGEYKTLNIESYLSKYSESTNDKYLVFAIANGENFFMTDAMKQTLTDTYGFKNIYFSISDFWGEFKPTAPDCVDVRLPLSGGLYALTEYGNEIYNLSTATDVYYNQGVDARLSDYELDLAESGFTQLSPKTSGTYGLASRNIAIGRDNVGTSYQTTSEPVRTNSGDIIYFTCYWDYHFDEFSSPPNLNVNGSGSINASGSVTIDGKVFDVANSYTTTYSQASVIETTSGEVYYIAPKGTMNDYVSTFSYTKLDIDSIDAVYHTSVNEGHALSSLYYNDEDWGDKTINRDVKISFGLLKDDIFIIKDQSGKYALLKPDTSVYARYGEYSYTTSKGKTYYSWKWFPTIATDHFVKYFNDLGDLSFAKYSATHYETYGQGLFYTDRKYIDKSTNYFGALPQYPYATNNTLSVLANYSLVDIDGDLYVNNKKITSNVRGADVNTQAIVYVDKNGVVYGKGTSNTGSLGLQGVKNSFGKVFNTPYILNNTYNTKSFSSIYDFTSENPAYGLTARGVYSTIIDAIIQKYADYSTDETILIQVGDSIDVGGTVLDYEGDPIKDMRIDAEVVPGYFDNTDSVITLPNDFTEPVPINSAGKILARARVQDENIFDEFDYWNKDNTTLTVIAHRPPIAVQKVAIIPQGDGTFNFVSGDGGSYDLDHSISRADKGIVDKKYYYRKALEPTWTEYSGTLPIENGVAYQFALAVKDLEGAWSDYDIVDVEINGSPFILNASIDPAYPTSVPAGSTATITADIFTYKSMASVIANVDGTNVTLSKVSQDGMNSTYRGTYTVPSSKADRDYYDVTVNASAADGAVRSQLLKLNVNTPLSLTGEISPYEIKKGTTAILTAQTSIYADSCIVSIFDDLYGGSAQQIDVALTKTAISGDKQNWTNTYIFDNPQLDALSEGVYDAVFSASTANGNSASYIDTFMFIPNQPPRVWIENIRPDFIYEGDDVIIQYRVQDPDLDPLYVKVDLSEDGGSTWMQIDEISGVAITDTAGKIMEVSTENVEEKVYDIRIRAVDPLGESAQAIGQFSAEPLTVSGAVNHTAQWAENRRLFNQSKTETDDLPRSSQTFWPGEQLVLSAITTVPQSGATTTCNRVTAYIQGHSDKAVSLNETSPGRWQGTLWYESMMDWKTQTVDVVFEAHYSNGVIKQDIQCIQVDDSEPYWQHHRLF